jgi:hypothetical protein
MQATVQTTRSGFNRMKLTLVAAGILVSSVTTVGALSLTGALPGIGGEETVSMNATAADAQLRALAMDRAEFTEWQSRIAVVATDTDNLEANGLPIVPAVGPAESADTEYLEANGLPVVPIVIQPQSTGTEYLEANGLPIYVEQH